MSQDCVALIPVNRLDRAKGRLADLLSPPERAALALVTLGAVLDAARSAGLHAVILAAEASLAAHLPPGAEVLLEQAGRHGLTDQLEGALARLHERDVAILHADLPLATGAALATVLAAAPSAPSATLVRSSDGGTNVMLLRPPGRFPLQYGPDSFALHSAAAAAAGVTVASVDAPGLALDLDTPDDLRRFLARAESGATAAGRYLASIGIAARLPNIPEP